MTNTTNKDINKIFSSRSTKYLEHTHAPEDVTDDMTLTTIQH